ncbi:hypothetical protein KM92DES2_11999 [uncultured Desulfovibrio sp.]|uniref:Uncharacterized protein n=1 Tax=uncultured Desulfovibrio sp. TaxID=167968 RepID=A0A212K021_9BACT|nr:hypothetical protein KM92DES2_11999 [uncultured Desulfovibrio sp.]
MSAYTARATCKRMLCCTNSKSILLIASEMNNRHAHSHMASDTDYA